MNSTPFDPVLSIFRSATDPNPLNECPLSTVVARIRSPELAEVTSRIRDAFSVVGGGKAGKAATANLKRGLPAVTLAGTFQKRSNAQWTLPSGLVQFDLDELTQTKMASLQAQLIACPWVACLWVSPSGAGLKGAIRVASFDHAPKLCQYGAAWRAVTRWMESIGLLNDPAAKDAARLAFLAHDPLAWHNPNAQEFDQVRWANPNPFVPVQHPEAGIESRALKYVLAMPKSIAGQNGSSAMMAVIRTLVDGFQLSGVSLRQTIERWNAENANPPWSPGEIDHALDSVSKETSKHPRGWLLAQSPNRPVGTELRQETGTTWASERLMAERLAAGKLRRALRYLAEGPSTGWHRWDGISWVPAPEPVPLALSAEVHGEAGALIAMGMLDNRKACSLESTNSMRAILTQLQAHEPMRLDLSSIDPPYLLATASGILDLKTGVVSQPDPDATPFLHRALVAFDPAATHPFWDAVASHVASLPGGDVVWRYLGASLLGLPPDRKLLVLIGDGGDGKGTLLRSCVAALGGFGSVLPAEALSGDGRGAHGHELLSCLAYARLAYASEVPPDLDWPLLKALSGGDLRRTKRMHERATDLQPRVWLALATNTPPKVPDQAAAERCVIIPWNKPAEPDGEIGKTLVTNGPDRDAYLRACLRWLVEGARMYLHDGLGVPDFAKPKIEAQGLCAWWEWAVNSGLIVPKMGWTSFATMFKVISSWHADQHLEPPSTREVGMFLACRLQSGRRGPDKVRHYGCTVHEGT